MRWALILARQRNGLNVSLADTTDAPDLGRASDLSPPIARIAAELAPLGLVAGAHPAAGDGINEAERIQEQERRSGPGDKHWNAPRASGGFGESTEVRRHPDFAISRAEIFGEAAVQSASEAGGDNPTASRGR